MKPENMFKKIKKNNYGFTLIELLVVISIIGLLASSATYSFNLAKLKSADVEKIASLDQLRKAMELYYDNNNMYELGHIGQDCCDYKSMQYPDVIASPYGRVPSDSPTCIEKYACSDCSRSTPGNFLDGLASTTLKVLISRGEIDRLITNMKIEYSYTEDNQEYKFAVKLSSASADLMENDGGRYKTVYEVGNNLRLPSWVPNNNWSSYFSNHDENLLGCL